ncbi:hypothetical protein G6F68_011401 [Rhizopus microsporus]|nr:hypothetical protein G6F68_011401 [Rhizopus microsporus]
MTQEWLKSNEVKVIDWPAYSPDLNPIENMWYFVKCELAKYDEPPKGMLELWERVQHIWNNKINKDMCLSLSSSSWPVVPSKPSATSLKVPPNLPLMQWKGAVFDSSATASDDAKHCLQKFQDIMSSHGLSFDHHWLRLLPPCLSAAQRAWLDEYQTKEPVLTWEKFKLAFIDKIVVYLHGSKRNS